MPWLQDAEKEPCLCCLKQTLCQLRTRFLATNYQKARSCHHARENLFQSPQLTAHWQSTHGNCRSGLLPQARKTATFINESCVTKRPASELTCAKLIGGTTPRPIAHVLPEIKSPFNLQTWHECLRTHPDTYFVIDSLHDIEVGVHIGYQPATRAFQTCNNHLFARTNRWHHICFLG